MLNIYVNINDLRSQTLTASHISYANDSVSHSLYFWYGEIISDEESMDTRFFNCSLNVTRTDLRSSP